MELVASFFFLSVYYYFKQVYEHELEKEFNYFEDLLKTFPLYRGNRSRDSSQPEEDSDQPIGYLKVHLN